MNHIPDDPSDDPSDDPFDALDEALERKREVWLPENPGDKVKGRVIDVREVQGQYGISPAVTILTREGNEVRINGYGTVLRREFDAASPEPGDLFAVKFEGLRPTAAGREFRSYRVLCLNADGTAKRRPIRPSEPVDETDPSDELPFPDDDPGEGY